MTALFASESHAAESASRMGSWDMMDDATLMARIQDGSRHAFTVLVERHAERFYRVAYRMLRHRETAEDMVQESFLKLWEQPDAWQADAGAKFTTWFYRIIVNRCLDVYKKKRPLPLKEELVLVDPTPRQDETLASREQAAAVAGAIAALPERQRTALTLCFYEELSNQEAADIMGLTVKAVQSLIMRAKAGLKQQLHAYAGG